MKIDTPLPTGKAGHLMRGPEPLPLIDSPWALLAFMSLLGTVAWLVLFGLFWAWS